VRSSSRKDLLLPFTFFLLHQALPFCAETLDGRIDRIIGQMTIQEKILQLHGEGSMNTADNTRLGIPGFAMADGPHGVREGMGTCFPVGIAMAATWDVELMFQVGAAMGREFRGKGIHQALGPCMDLCRDPRNGRSPESGGEDPYLCAQITTAVTRGIQSTQCIATIKHFNCKNRQYQRTENDHTVSMRNLMEHYGLNFRTAVQAGGALSVMNAYNLINGEKCAENGTLLETILREKWGFPFYVVSDWGSIWNSEKAVKAGCDICMGSSNYKDDMPGLAASGAVPESVIHEAVRRVLLTKITAGMLDDTPAGDPDDVNCEAHKRLCREAGSRGIILLKNEGGLLPLNRTTTDKIAVVGPSAGAARLDGSGSSYVTPYYSVSPRQGITARIGPENVLYAAGCDIHSGSTAGFGEALQQASSADVVVYIGGLDPTQEGEGIDRVGDSIDLPGKQQDLIIELAKVNPNLVVVLESGGICGINRSIGRIKALVYAFYPGQEGGNAIADVLFGDVNPGGKLPVTMPADDSQLPERNKNFNDDFGCGYRWFDEKGIPPLFAFGFGLSYTTFRYAKLSVAPSSVPAGQSVRVSVDVENTGQIAGDEVVQLYLAHAGSKVPMPRKQLKGFRRVTLEPGEIKTVVFTITPDELYFYDEAAGCYAVDSGDYTVLAGGSSDNLPLTGQFRVTSSAAAPDLLIANVRTIPPNPVKDSRVLFMATVLNRGTGPSPGGVAHRVSFRVDGTEAAQSNGFVGSIPAGGMALVVADGGNEWTAGEPGSYAVEAAVDPLNAITECVENNNMASISMEVLPPPPKNLAAGATVTVSSVEGPGYEGGKAVDGNLKTRWSSAWSDPQTITLDLGGAYSIDRVVLNWEAAFGKDYMIQTSVDGSAWSTALHVTGGDGGTDRLSISGTTRFLRMVGIKRGTEWGYSLYEFQVYSDQITSVPSKTNHSDGFFLSHNYPNPFSAGGGSAIGGNLSTSVTFVLPERAAVALHVLDVRGRRIKEIFRGVKEAGRYEASWDGRDGSGNAMPSGMYLFEMRSGTFRAVQKMVYAR
jgi:beta-glucosidase